MKPAILLASPTVRRRLSTRRALRALKSMDADLLPPADQGFLRLALEVFSKDEKGEAVPLSR